MAAEGWIDLLYEAERGPYLVSDDPAKLDVELACDYLRGSYWASDVPRTEILSSIENSLTFGLYQGGGQIGFARVITDYARFAYLADVFVLQEHCGRGLGRWLVECVLDHPDLRTVRKWTLATRDAHRFYRDLGFTEVDAPDWLMERKP